MKAFFTILAAVITTAGVWAQSPMKMSYQAVIRNTSDELVTNQPIGLRISILQGSVNGIVVYTETQAAVSNSIGLVSIEVGGGVGFDAINWANGPYFIRTETDPEGGTNYTISNTSQLLSVPYALHAKTAESFSDGITETDPVFDASPAKSISGSDIINWNNKQDKLIAGNHIVITGDTISATGLLPDGTAPGEMLYWNGSAWVVVPPGTHGKILYFCNGVPTWGGCPPLLKTVAVYGITPTTATSGGYVTNDGGFMITACGICWSTSAGPDTSGNHTMDGSDTGVFVSKLTNLLPNTTYYVRTYATNSAGTAYGNEVSFTTSSLNQTATCFAAPDGINDYNWSYKDYVIPAGYRIDSVYMDASRPGYSEDKYDLLIAYCPGTSTYASSKVIFLFEYESVSTPMYNTWLNLTNLSVKATGMIRVKLPTHERAVWNKLCFAISEISDSGWSCGISFTVNHVAGAVAPFSKTVSYGTVTNIPGEPTKCWITQNLGADHQATSFNDSTEASAGWYWQFNRKQGFKFDGAIRTPNTTWIDPISENSNWTAANDPCALELGSGWRIPTKTEWYNLDSCGNWTNWTDPWNSNLKLHASNGLDNDYGMGGGITGYFWSSSQSGIYTGFDFSFGGTIFSYSTIGSTSKSYGLTLRCIKDNATQASLPTVTTDTITKITSSTASGGGKVSNDGGSAVTARGICWNTSFSPTIADNHTIDGNGTGNYISSLAGLNPNTIYCTRAYATNNSGTAYGDEVNFITLPPTCGLPFTINHNRVKSVAPITKTVTYGTVANIPGEPTKCWITQNLGADHQATSVDDATEASAGWYWQFNHKQGYQHDGTIRTPNTTWINSIDESSDWTSANDPCTIELGTRWRIPTSSEWTNVDESGKWANWNGPWNSGLNLNAAGGLGNNGWLFSRGAYGNYWSSFQSSGNGGWCLHFSSDHSDAGYSYMGYAYPLRCLKDATAQISLPTVTTVAISNITFTTGLGGGDVIDDGGANIRQRGVCWGTSPNPITNDNTTSGGSGTGTFGCSLSGLNTGVLYYARAFAENILGTAYGNEVIFTTKYAGYSIGQNYGGGIIYYIDSTGQHGLIAAPYNQSNGAEWGCDSTFIGGTRGNGRDNTLAIINGCGQAGTAAQLCYDLVLNGYEDWFLPSIYELTIMCNEPSVISEEDFNPYWSSSELDASFAKSYYCGYHDSEYLPKNYTCVVRAVRAF